MDLGFLENSIRLLRELVIRILILAIFHESGDLGDIILFTINLPQTRQHG